MLILSVKTIILKQKPFYFIVPTSAPTLPCGGADLRNYEGSTVTATQGSYDWSVTIGPSGTYTQSDTATYNIGTHDNYGSDFMSARYLNGGDCGGNPRAGDLYLSWTTGPSSVSFTEPCGCCYVVNIEISLTTCLLP